MMPTNRVFRFTATGSLLLVLSIANYARPDNLELESALRKIVENNLLIHEQIEAGRLRASNDVGICSSRNFTVVCTSVELDSRDVLAKAEALRKRIAIELLGAELPNGEESTIIHVTISPDSDEGLTRISERAEQGPHRIWITSSKQRALGSTLAHEIAHIVLSGQFETHMPAWANEGLASLYDDSGRDVRRLEILSDFVQSGDWPSIDALLNAKHVAPSNEQGYALSVSLTQFFLRQGSPRELMRFIQQGMHQDWQRALNTVYGIRGSRELQARWQRWVTQRVTQPRFTSRKLTKDDGSRI